MMRDLGQFDLIVVGGGVNGAGIARDAAGRGLKAPVVRKGRSRAGHLVALGQARSRRPALSRILRIPTRAGSADRARGPAARGAPHHLADAIRAAAQSRPASRLDGPHRPLPLRPPRRPQDFAADAKLGSVERAGGQAPAKELQARLRIFGLLGRRRAACRRQRHRCSSARRPGADQDLPRIGAP